MYYKLSERTPEEGHLVICKCPDWCKDGYAIARLKNGKFRTDSTYYGAKVIKDFNEYVISWTPLNKDGEQTDNIHTSKAMKYDQLSDAIADVCNSNPFIDKDDLVSIGEISATHFGWI